MVLKIIKEELKLNNQGKRLTEATFECGCGEMGVAWKKDINYGSVRSCGCLVKKNHYKKHGLSSTRTYRIWMGMKARCDNPNNKAYKDYGGRGITYQEDWANFICFFKDMGEAPEGLWLERIDNNQGYSRENCRWATPQEQLSNTTRNVKLTFDGKKRTLSEIARITGLSSKMLSKRLKRGWSEYDTIYTPPVKNGNPRRQNST